MSVLCSKHCPRCGKTLGLYLTDGSYEMRHRGRIIRILAPARIEIVCEDCQHLSPIALDKEYAAALA